jgi:polyphosphate kinase 2 (PPK2 family)
LSRLQNVLYASNQYALLLIFQAMDAAGKDSAIKHVMSGVNPQGCQVFSFKHPSTEELEHDFLWRTTRCLPERGRIGIFNRSYYEEVLIARVHPEILKAENLPDKVQWKYWKDYMQAYEACLSATSTHAAPWYIVPADDKQNTSLIVSQIVVNALDALRMSYPKPSLKGSELASIRKSLAK